MLFYSDTVDQWFLTRVLVHMGNFCGCHRVLVFGQNNQFENFALGFGNLLWHFINEERLINKNNYSPGTYVWMYCMYRYIQHTTNNLTMSLPQQNTYQFRHSREFVTPFISQYIVTATKTALQPSCVIAADCFPHHASNIISWSESGDVRRLQLYLWRGLATFDQVNCVTVCAVVSIFIAKHWSGVWDCKQMLIFNSHKQEIISILMLKSNL